jgi:DNA-binding beta-propeller fold protein YncE
MRLKKRHIRGIGANGMAALVVLAALGANPVRAESSAPPKVDYEFTGQIDLGAPAFNDYLTFDPNGRRLYVSHVDRVTVIDVEKRAVVGSVAPLKDSHGIAIVSKLSKGYADSGDDGIVKVFSLTDFHVIKEIKVSPDADGMLYDERTGSVLVVAGDSKNLTVINPADDTVIRTVALPGKPEFMALDEAGNVYVNLADIASLVKVNIASGKVEANWPLENCKAPHGLAYDPPSNRLFSGCANSRLVVVDASSGRNLANLPIGSFSDSVAIDSHRRLVFTSNGPGTLTAISIGPDDHFSVARTLPTFFGGRNMTLDPATGALYVAHGHMKVLSSMKDPLKLRFGWDGIDVATFEPRL